MAAASRSRRAFSSGMGSGVEERPFWRTASWAWSSARRLRLSRRRTTRGAGREAVVVLGGAGA